MNNAISSIQHGWTAFISRLGKYRPSRPIWRDRAGRQELFVLVMLLVLGVFLSLRTDIFLTSANLSNLSRYLSWIAIAAFGESLVIMTGGIDLSVGAVMALAGLLAAMCLKAGIPTPLSIIIGLSLGGVAGGLNGFLVGRVRLPSFVVTLGTMCLARGITFSLTGGWPVRSLPPAFRFLGQRDLVIGALTFPMPVLIMLALAVLVILMLEFTVLGRYIYTLGGNEKSLLFAGINPTPVKMLVFTLSGVFAAAGGMLMTAHLGVAAPNAASGYELDIIAAAIIGGTSLFGGNGSIFGVLLGTAFLQLLRNGLVILSFPVYWQTIAIGAMILIALLIDYFRYQREQ